MQLISDMLLYIAVGASNKVDRRNEIWDLLMNSKLI